METRVKAHTRSERRLATILFADISGFTSMSEKMDAELVTRTMNECFNMLGTIVQRNGGIIDKYIGDCIMVLFGVPKALEDSARRAVQTGLEMREAIRESQHLLIVEAKLDIHIGINTGEVISGEVGSEQKKEFTVMGDVVNIASRLKDAAPKGRIYVGLQTHHKTSEMYEYKIMESIKLKGKKNPVPVYELLSRKLGVARGRMIFSPLVARQEELNLLESKVLNVISGEGSIVHVIGEAGLGKSRLIAELRNKECIEKVILLEGRAQSFGMNLSFYPIINLLKEWTAIHEDDSGAEASRKLEKAIRSVSPEDIDETLPFIATLMGIPLTGKYAQRMEGIVGDILVKLMMRTTHDLLSCAAQYQPLVIVLDDMHWADESTVEFVEYLYSLADRNHVLFINLFRPSEEKGERLSKTARENHGSLYTEIMLYHLNEESCTELVGNLIKNSNVPPAIMESIVSRTGGNPFFVEEIMRACIDNEALEVEKDGFRVTEKLQSFIVPSTVNEVIMSRFDRLDEVSGELLRAASVIGRSFFYRLLVNIVQGIDKIDEKINTLKEMQIILERNRVDEIEFLFKHALVQETIYDSILIQARKNLHISVANAIESIFAERLGEFTGMLALHYTRGEDYDKAEKYMIRAGEEALKAAGSAEALNYYRDALELYLKKQGSNADPADVVMLKKNIARSLYFRGRYDEAIPIYDFVLRYHGIQIPKSRLALLFSAAAGLVEVLLWLYGPKQSKLKPLSSNFREGIALSMEKSEMLVAYDPPGFFLQTLALAKIMLRYDLSDCDPGLRMLVGISTLFSFSGISLSVCRRVIEKMSRIIRHDQPGVLINYLSCKSFYSYLTGEWNERRIFRDPMVGGQAEQGSAFEVLNLFAFSGLSCIECGDWETYFEARDMVEMISDRFDNNMGRMFLHLLIHRYYIKRRMIKEATASMPGLLIFFSRVSSSLGETQPFSAHASLARINILRGDFESAVKNLNAIPYAVAVSPRGPWRNGVFCCTYAAMAVEKALQAAKQGKLNRQTRRKCLFALNRNLKNSRKFAPDRTEALKFEGSYWWHAGSFRRALEYWNRSIREGERLGTDVEVAHTFMDAGNLLGEIKPGPEWRNRGKELYSKLGIK